MSTQINLTIGDQRLLQANKTRTAANQQALDDRTASKQLEQKTTEAAETAAPEERPGALPDTSTRRRPAAQRKPKEEAGLLLLNLLHPTKEDTTTVTGNYWERYVQKSTPRNPARNSLDIDLSAGTVSIGVSDRRITYSTIKINPYINTYEQLKPDQTSEQAPVSSGTYSAYTYKLFSVVSSFFSWITKFRILIYVGNLFDDTPVPTAWYESTNPTAFPLQTVNSPITVYSILHSSTSSYTYLSYVYIYNECNAINATIGPNLVDSFNGRFNTNYVSRILVSGATRTVLALYIKIDHTQQTTSTRIVTLSSIFSNSITTTAAPTKYLYDQEKVDFIANMDTADPRKAIYQETTRTDYAMDPELNGCMYNPETGACYVTGTDKEYKKVFITQHLLAKGLSYDAALRGTAKSVSQHIATNFENAAGAQLPNGFQLRNKFTNTSGPLTAFGDYYGLPRYVYVTYG